MTPVGDGRRWWVPGNRWDLVVDRVRLAPPTRLAVIIPYFEQPDSLRRMYAALEVAEVGVPWEVVVVDDGSSEPPPAPPDGLVPAVRVLRQEDRGVRPGAARHLGVAATDAEVLVFLDADTLPTPTTIARMAAWPSTVPDALVVGLRHHIDLDGWSPRRLQAWLTGRVEGPPRRRDPAWLSDRYAASGDLLHATRGDYRSVISAVMSCHRVLYDDVGGFDVRRDEYGGEDWDLAARAYHHGAVLVHEPAAVAYHDEPDWEDRSDDADAKQREHAWLAGHTTDPSARGNGLLHPHPDVVTTVELGSAHWQDWAGTVDALLHACPDQHLYLLGDTDDRLADYVAADPRVRFGPAGPASSHRGLIDVHVRRVHPWTKGSFRQLVAPIIDRDAGVVRGCVHGELVATATSNRRTGRVRRAATFGVALPDDAFATREVALEPCCPSGRPARLDAAGPLMTLASRRLRIAIVAQAHTCVAEPFVGGLEAHTYGLASGLAERGHDVVVHSGPTPGRHPFRIRTMGTAPVSDRSERADACESPAAARAAALAHLDTMATLAGGG